MRLPRVLGRTALLPLVLVVACGAACSSKDSGPAPADGGGTQAFVARFALPKTGAPDLLQIPFPSDVFLGADGTIQLAAGNNDAPTGLDRLVPRLKGAQFVADALARTHGFGVYGGALFALDGAAPDVAKLPTGKPGDCTTKDSPIVFFDVDAGTAVECRASWNDDGVFRETASSGDPLTPVLVVRTARGVVLPEGHRIAIVLTRGVVDQTGAPLTASADFAALRDGPRDASPIAGDYGGAIDAVVHSLGVDKQRIVAAAVYTTGHVTDELRAARELARATPVPTLKWGAADVDPVKPARFTAETPLPAGWTATLDDWLGAPTKLTSGDRAGHDDPDWGSGAAIAHDAIGAVGTASFDAPSFLIDEIEYGSPNHGTFFHDAAGKVAINPVKPTARVWVSFAVPKGAMPVAGWPVVVFQHGMGGQRGDMLSMANTYAEQGWATASIELVLSGTRGSTASKRGDSKSDYKRSTAKYDGPDGFTDRASDGSNEPPTELFGNLFRVAALRDQFRQGALDHTTLVRLLSSSPSLDGLASGGVTPKIDGSKVAYSGDSLGGIHGALIAGIEPDYRAYVLNVPGGGLFGELVTDAPTVFGLLQGAGSLFFGYSHAQLHPNHPLVQLLQHVMDGGDPFAVASTVTAPVAIAGNVPKPRNVVLYEVLADELVANEATEGLARAMGLPVITPRRSDLLATLKDVDGAAGVHDVPSAGATGALIQVFPATHGSDLYSKHGTRNYAYPTHLFGDPSQEPFPKLTPAVTVDEPYLALQAVTTRFIADAFAGKAPTVTWTLAPAVVDR